MFFSLLYEFALFVIALAAIPKFLYQMIFKGKYRGSLLKRFGGSFPIIKKGKRPLIWVHAVSLGETKAVAALVKNIKQDYKNPLIVFSTITETGYVEACRTIQADYHVYLPFDFGWVIKSIVKRTAPDLVVLCESDLWYNFLNSSKQAGAKIVLVNGKLSVKSKERFVRFPFFARRLFSLIDLFCVQSKLYGARFKEVGVPDEKIVVTGNMKFDGDYSRLPSQQLEAWRSELGILPKDPVLVIGSTHHPEETLFLDALQPVWKSLPDLKVLFVPRHPERFSDVAALLQKADIDFRRLSEKNQTQRNCPVILIDAMGLLRKCYQLADVAIVAGSYTPKVGGHNILEPSWYGVPVVFGPHMYSQPDLLDLVTEYAAGSQVGIEDLSSELIGLFKDPERRKAIGRGGLRLAADVHGATSKTLAEIKSHFLDK